MERSYEIIIMITPNGKPDDYNEMRVREGKKPEGIIFKKTYALKSISNGLIRDEIKKMTKRLLEEHKLKYPGYRLSSMVRESTEKYRMYVGGMGSKFSSDFG